MGENNISLLEVEVKQGKLFIQTQLKDDGREGFMLSVTDGTGVWEGALSEENLDNLSSKRKMDFNTYVDQTRAALTQGTNYTDNLSFEYHFTTAGDKDAQFVWKKHVVEDDIKFQLGVVRLKKAEQSDEKLCQILSGCVIRSQQLQSEIKTLQSDNERLSMERQNALKRLDKCVTAKEALEKDLYAKFAAVLNAKKEHIRHLQENGASAPMEDEPVPSRSRKSPSPEAAASKDEENRRRPHEDSDDISTDEEISLKKQRRKAAVSSKPSRLSAEGSLNLGDDDDVEEEQKKAPAVRRPRRKPPARKETPAKPVLPRVSSGNSASKNAGSSRKPSLRKSGSEQSNKSSDNLDPNDLLDNF